MILPSFRYPFCSFSVGPRLKVKLQLLHVSDAGPVCLSFLEPQFGHPSLAASLRDLGARRVTRSNTPTLKAAKIRIAKSTMSILLFP